MKPELESERTYSSPRDYEPATMTARSHASLYGHRRLRRHVVDDRRRTSMARGFN
jgi:hypothetical protein